MKWLAIETSCDDTSVAVLTDERAGQPELRAVQVITQKDLHEKFGGIVPENASRAHLEVLDIVVERTLEQAGISVQDISAIAVTCTPGLEGSLLVGVCYAKALARTLGIPCLGTHHLEGHLAAPLLALRTGQVAGVADTPSEIFPALAWVVSGGHTTIYTLPEWGQFQELGSTRDDAVGECFDKTARLMGLEYPGGPQMNKLAEAHLKKLCISAADYDPRKGRSSFSLPRPRPGTSWTENLEMSFSGLKTAVRLLLEKDPRAKTDMEDLALGIHESIGEVMWRKCEVALDRVGSVKSVWLTGGVAANSLLRAWFGRLVRERGCQLLVAPPRLCTDNAAMIGYAAMLRWQAASASQRAHWQHEAFEVRATSSVESFAVASHA